MWLKSELFNVFFAPTAILLMSCMMSARFGRFVKDGYDMNSFMNYQRVKTYFILKCIDLIAF